MLDKDITEAHATLVALKSRLTSDLEELAVHNPHTDDWELRLDDTVFTADENDRGDIGEAAEEKIATLALLETRYRNVVRALEKIATNTYGICEISGEAIEIERLRANPAARTCLHHLEDEDLLPL
jgi:RNA polymerase-binding transcription factor DksA